MRRLKGITLIGVLLIILGAVSIAYDQVSYTRREKIIDIGPVEATVAKEAHCVRLPIIFGILVIIAGGSIVWIEVKKQR